MKKNTSQRWLVILGFFLVVGVLSGCLWAYAYRQALDTLAERSVGDLALASDRVSTQLQVYQELAVLMADHPVVENLVQGGDRVAADRLLREVADKTAALDVLFADTSGMVLASASWELGFDVSTKDYFLRAMHGSLGTGYGVLAPENRRAYVYAAPAFAKEGGVLGALIIVADIQDVEQTWRGSLPAVFFTNDSDEVFISNRPELLFWKRAAVDRLMSKDAASVMSFRIENTGGHEIWKLGSNPHLPDEALHIAVDLPVLGLSGEILVDVAPAKRIAFLQTAALTALCLAFGTLLFLTTERRRTLAEANAVLESRVAARTMALEAANDQLRREVREREDAEAALKQAQQDLVRAGKLSALGQMSAGISHELNQPLMAIQQYAENGSAFLARNQQDRVNENLSRIATMASRMARIIKNLRSFARNENEPRTKVDLVQVIDSAVELTSTRLRSDGVTLDWQKTEQDPVYAWGGEVRLTQVFVNLINNAADAMLTQSERAITLRIEVDEQLSVTIQDIGPGIKEPEKVFDPFYSTKVVGSSEGLGLGLSISYGLLQSFGGNIRGTNTAKGAKFTVELEPWRPDASGLAA